MPANLIQSVARLMVILAITICVGGCAYVEERFTDVTDDPKFQIYNRKGDIYRLRSDVARFHAVKWGLAGKEPAAA